MAEEQKVLIGNFKGPKGDQGAPGTPGVTGERGTRGSKHFDGVLITGTATNPTKFTESGVTEAMLDDWYLNTDTGNMYRCVTEGDASVAEWVFIGNMKGPKGDIGDVDDALSDTSENAVQNKVVAAALKDKLDKNGDGSNVTVAFSYASSRANIESGEKASTIFGKIGKFFKDLKTVAFTGSYNDLSDKPTVPGQTRVKGDAETAYREGDVNLTPENIGAAPSSHDQAASTITAGTFAGKMNADASAMATFTNAQLRDIVVLESDPGEGATVSYAPGTIVGTK